MDGVELNIACRESAFVIKGTRNKPTKFAVDASHELIHRLGELPVLLHILSRRYGDLEQYHLADPVWVFFEKNLKGMKLLRYALDVVESVHTDDDLDAFVLRLETSNTLLHFWLLQALFEFARVDANGERASSHDFSMEGDSIWRGFKQSRIMSVYVH